MRQLLNLLSQHRFYAAVCILGTAVTLAFVMMVVMVYDFRTADVAPESRRSRALYNTGVQVSMPDGTQMYGYGGLSARAYEALYDSLPGVETRTWHGGLLKYVAALPASSDRRSLFVRPVAANWFGFFDYDFVAGRPFTQVEYDAGRAAIHASDDESREYESRDDGMVRRFVVISEHMARDLFGGVAEAVGQDFLLDFQPVRVTGVVRDVSSIFQTAYADIWMPGSLLYETPASILPAYELKGNRYAVLLLEHGARPAQVRTEVERRLDRLNDSSSQFVLSDLQLYDHTAYTFFRSGSIDTRLLYALLLVVLLVVPAVGISGLVHAQMQSRLPEIAIRKAYGASNTNIVGHLFAESLATTVVGGVLGYGLSCLLVWAGSTWLFGMDGVQQSAVLLDSSLLLRPQLFVAVLAACLVFNVLSTLLPAYLAVHRSISYTLVGGE